MWLLDNLSNRKVDLNTAHNDVAKPDDTKELLGLKSICCMLTASLTHVLNSRDSTKLY